MFSVLGNKNQKQTEYQNSWNQAHQLFVDRVFLQYSSLQMCWNSQLDKNDRCSWFQPLKIRYTLAAYFTLRTSIKAFCLQSTRRILNSWNQVHQLFVDLVFLQYSSLQMCWDSQLPGNNWGPWFQPFKVCYTLAMYFTLQNVNKSNWLRIKKKNLKQLKLSTLAVRQSWLSTILEPSNVLRLTTSWKHLCLISTVQVSYALATYFTLKNLNKSIWLRINKKNLKQLKLSAPVVCRSWLSTILEPSNLLRLTTSWKCPCAWFQLFKISYTLATYFTLQNLNQSILLRINKDTFLEFLIFQQYNNKHNQHSWSMLAQSCSCKKSKQTPKSPVSVKPNMSSNRKLAQNQMRMEKKKVQIMIIIHHVKQKEN